MVPTFSPDVFKGTATYYDRYRPAYPETMLADLRERGGVTGHGRLVDLASGTGEVALALAPNFAEVQASDLEPEMVELGREKSARLGFDHVQWSVSPAEEVEAPDGGVEMVTIGNAFHRVRRDVVAGNAMRWLEPGKIFAVMGSSSLWIGKEEWQSVAVGVTRKWIPSGGLAGNRSGTESGSASGAAATESKPAEEPKPAPEKRQTHEEALRSAGFVDVKEYPFWTPHTWTLDDLIGYLYSTSVVAQAQRAGIAEEFEADFRETMLAYDSSGVYQESIYFYYMLARKPG